MRPGTLQKLWKLTVTKNTHRVMLLVFRSDQRKR
jgi:hypothetical protein